MKTHTPKRLSKLARKCSSKKEMVAAGLKGEELAECRRIKAVQVSRYQARETAVIDNCRYGSDSYGIASYYMVPQKLGQWERRQIKRSAWKSTRRWPWSSNYGYSFSSRIADGIMEDWSYKWRLKQYHVSVIHNSREISFTTSRSASSYDTFYVTIHFDLLRQEAVWIGGLLTIRAKADRLKKSYPCSWFTRKTDGPGLILTKGSIQRYDFHEEDPVIGNARRETARLKRALRNTRPPKGSGWVTRAMSVEAGNCEYGTDHFIHNKLVPYLQQHGVTVGDLTGTAVQRKLLFVVDPHSSFIRRIP